MNVKVYSTPTCGYCRQAKNFLHERGVQFTEYDVSRDQAAAQEMVSLTGQMGVPVIAVDGQAVIGFDRARLERLLAKGGGNGKRPGLGLKIADASRITQKAGGIPIFGAYIGAVAPGSPARRAGLGAGDIVTGISLRPIKNAADMEQALASLATGGRITIDFLRGQQSHTVEIVL
ncbi:MAG: glutaredoxin domain-containing protein [Dehalococcoidia bacterium]